MGKEHTKRGARVIISPTARFFPSSLFADDAVVHGVVGEKASVGPRSRVGLAGVLGHDAALGADCVLNGTVLDGIRVGNACSIGHFSLVDVPLGNDCTVEDGVLVHPSTKVWMHTATAEAILNAHPERGFLGTAASLAGLSGLRFSRVSAPTYEHVVGSGDIQVLYAGTPSGDNAD